MASRTRKNAPVQPDATVTENTATAPATQDDGKATDAPKAPQLRTLKVKAGGKLHPVEMHSSVKIMASKIKAKDALTGEPFELETEIVVFPKRRGGNGKAFLASHLSAGQRKEIERIQAFYAAQDSAGKNGNGKAPKAPKPEPKLPVNLSNEELTALTEILVTLGHAWKAHEEDRIKNSEWREALAAAVRDATKVTNKIFPKRHPESDAALQGFLALWVEVSR